MRLDRDTNEVKITARTCEGGLCIADNERHDEKYTHKIYF